MRKYKFTKIILLLFIIILFSISAKNVDAVGYITPTVQGVIASSDIAYRPSVTYPEWNTISGHYLYYGSNWDNILTIVDVSDPLNPIEMSSLHDGDTGAIIKSPKGITIVGDYAYLINWDNATGNEIIEILNIADKSNPYHVSSFIYSYGSGDRTYSLFVKDDYIYIPTTNPTSANSSLIILDARDKANPVFAGSILNSTTGSKLSTPYNVSVVGNYAYVTAYNSDSLTVIDVTNKTNPTYVTSLVNGTGGAKLDGASGLQIIGNYAYVMSHVSNALEIVDISNPLSPTHFGSISDGTNGAKIYGYELVVNGNYAYLSSYSSHALEIVDISNPANPIHVAVVSDGDNGAALHRTRSVAYYNNTIYSSVTGSNVIEIIDVSTPASPIHINSINPTISLGGARVVKIHNGFAYVTAANSNALQIIDISDKSHPTPRGSIALRYNGAKLYSPLGIDFRGNYAYVVSTAANFGFGALEIIDISDPDHPTHVNSIVDGIYLGGAQNIKIVGDYGYVTASSRNTLEIIDIGSNPTNPSHIGSITSGTGGASLTTPFGIDVVGNYAYVTTSNALEIVNISNPANPTHAGSLANGTPKLSGAKYINVFGDYAYIASSTSSALEIVNISNPASPTHVAFLANAGSTKLGGAYGIYVSDNRAYIGSSTSNALEIVDVSTPASPTHLCSVSDGENGARLISARGVDIEGDYAYVVSYNGSSNALNIIRIKDSVAPVLSEVTPVPVSTKNETPSYSFTTNEAGTISYGGACLSPITTANVGLNTITFNTLSEGLYNDCSITITDALNNISSSLPVTPFTIDKTIPIMSLVGRDSVEIYTGQQYLDAGVTAIDNVDGDISSSILSTINNVNINIAGSYVVTYNVSDFAQNSALEITRTVNVLNRPSSGSTLAFRNNFLAQQKAILESQNEKINNNTSNLTTQLSTITKVLKPSTKKDNNVKSIQTYLNTVLNLKLTPDGIFGKQTKLAIMKFQKDHNLKQDGIVGPKTLKEMK